VRRLLRRAARVACAVAIAAFAGLDLHGEEWARFRGPNGTGVSPIEKLPIDLEPARALWKTRLSPGHSSPVLASDRLFVTAHEGGALLVIALDRKSGRILWRREVPRSHDARYQNVNAPASSSPVTDGENVYAFFQEFGLVSFGGDGRERWRLPLGPFQVFYGFGASPVLVDDRLILPVDQDRGSYLLAVDKDTGRVLWKVDRPDVISGYSTPTVHAPRTGPKQVLIPESFQLSAYSVADGRRVFFVRGLACEMKSVASYDGETLYVNGWGFPQNQPGQQVATVPFEAGLEKYDKDGDKAIQKPELLGVERSDRMGFMLKNAFEAFDLDRDAKLQASDWSVFRAMMASENGLLAIALGGEGDMTSSAVRWRYRRPVPQVPSTLLYRGVLFMVNDSGILISFDPLTGNVLKQGRLPGALDKYFASPVGGGGNVYLASQDGTISVVSGRGEWEVLAVHALGDEVFATPVLGADGTIFVRTKSALFGFGAAAAEPPAAAGAGERPERTPCCFSHPQFAGACEVIAGRGETCRSILAYLNNPKSVGKTYCSNTNLRGGWKSQPCRPARASPRGSPEQDPLGSPAR
jgi:outer membrane protein assembly factor BamB